MNERLRLIVRPFVLALALFAAAGSSPAPVDAALTSGQRDVLGRYLSALRVQRYDMAYALLTAPERRYFGSAANFASVYAADRLKIASFRILASTTDPRRGTVAVVSERIAFFDQAHQSPATATAKVAYGILPEPNGPRIKDPYHPWRAVAPDGLVATTSHVRAQIRKISFYTGRVEIVVTFQNLGDATVTLLPYGRSVVRDDRGKAYTPVATRLAGLTDKTLYTGLRLPASGQYTGLMTFLTPDRFVPKSLSITFAPALLDSGDAPFELVMPPYTLPA
ncbi:MAG: hypothetical protein IAI50_04105 [Candidatus Eremiobacteraeota bacterium]|nr:hypothetical protein [Candidatus Eremiobacteraeota bacterium]